MALEMSYPLVAAFAPVTVYWLYSGIYVALDPYIKQYRLHSKDEEAKNTVSKKDVVKAVLLQQTVQIAFFLVTVTLKEKVVTVKEEPSTYGVLKQLLFAMLVVDTWHYSLHRLFHANNFLYKNFHSRHHQQIVPYPYGALYNNQIEGFLVDTMSVCLAFLFSGMTPKTSIFFYTLMTIKIVEDHSGHYIPWNPFHCLLTNNVVFHGAHHQLFGLKHNFTTPFFNVWNRVMGTYLPCDIKKRVEGGYEMVALNNE